MNNPEHWHSSPTQIAWTCRALAQGRVISHRTEIREVRGWRLGAIVFRLKVGYGWPILSEYRGPDNVAHYRLAPGIDPNTLCYPPSARWVAEEMAQ